MTYRCLQLSPSTPKAVRHFITRTIEDLHFNDIHAMLRLPLPEDGITAGQNFAITQVLMAVVSSVSIMLYRNTGESGDLFEDVVEKFFPWDEEPSNDIEPKAAAGIIYDVFRNPLTHAAGVFTEKRKKGRDETRYLVQKSYVVKVVRWLPKDKPGHTEKWIEELEMASARPEMDRTLTGTADQKILLVEGLYWGVRRMIQNLTYDADCMARGGQNVKGLVYRIKLDRRHRAHLVVESESPVFAVMGP